MTDGELVKRANALAAIAEEKIEQCYDPVRGVYRQAVGVEHLDASTLKMITMGYLDPTSEKARRHLQALEGLLRTDQGLFYRYVHQDDFGVPEATFLVCAFLPMQTTSAFLARMSDSMDRSGATIRKRIVTSD
jgi:GH15 family glucan-1,4-alpha-glucosidase